MGGVPLSPQVQNDTTVEELKESILQHMLLGKQDPEDLKLKIYTKPSPSADADEDSEGASYGNELGGACVIMTTNGAWRQLLYAIVYNVAVWPGLFLLASSNQNSQDRNR